MAAVAFLYEEGGRSEKPSPLLAPTPVVHARIALTVAQYGVVEQRRREPTSLERSRPSAANAALPSLRAELGPLRSREWRALWFFPRPLAAP